jgi:hypothetical protein
VLSSTSLILTLQGSGAAAREGLRLEGLPAVTISSELLVQVVHADDDLSMVEPDELEWIFSGGGVTLRGGGAKYDFLRISQKDNISVPSSMMPFNLIPYLNRLRINSHIYVRVAYLVTTSLS